VKRLRSFLAYDVKRLSTLQTNFSLGELSLPNSLKNENRVFDGSIRGKPSAHAVVLVDLINHSQVLVSSKDGQLVNSDAPDPI